MMKFRSRNAGFSLLELAIVMIIVGLGLAVTFSALSGFRGTQNRKDTATRIAAVDVAIANFVTINKRLPCPADGALGVSGVSMGSPPWAAPYAFKLAVAFKDGKPLDKYNEIPMPLVTSEETVLCEKADLAELTAKDFKCNAVPLSVAPANYFIDVWSKEVPELDLNSALTGTVPDGQ